MKRFALFCLIPVLAAACATSPVALTDAKPVPADRVFAYGQPIDGPSGQLVVVRDQGAFGAACPIAVYVDGIVAAHFRTSETLTLHLTPGQHVIGAGPSGGGMCSWSNEAAHRRGIFCEELDAPAQVGSVKLLPLGHLGNTSPTIAVIASDRKKEHLLKTAAEYLSPGTTVVLGGFRHFEFADEDFHRTCRESLLPSYANGYPHTLTHLYQCLGHAARRNLKGCVAEFGMFKGGTTMLLSRFVELLGQDWPVYGFDTFTGFPAPRSVFDMYSHPDCVYLDPSSLRDCFRGRNVTIIEGDVVQTCKFLCDKDIVLAFVDTDNFTSAESIIREIKDRVVPGGAIVFDHLTGRDRFLYTLGERIAAQKLFEDERFFNLHDTGVFLRIQ